MDDEFIQQVRDYIKESQEKHYDEAVIMYDMRKMFEQQRKQIEESAIEEADDIYAEDEYEELQHENRLLEEELEKMRYFIQDLRDKLESI